MNDVLNDALSNLEHDNYERSHKGYENRQADIALIRAALAAQPAAATAAPSDEHATCNLQLATQAPAADGEALDAARYRWLRTRWGRIADEYDGDSDQLVAIREADSHFEGWDVDPLSLDRAIDAALAASTGQEVEK